MGNAALDNKRVLEKRVLVRVNFNLPWILMETFWTIEERN